MRTDVTIHTDTADESLALFRALAGMSSGHSNTKAAVTEPPATSAAPIIRPMMEQAASSDTLAVMGGGSATSVISPPQEPKPRGRPRKPTVTEVAPDGSPSPASPGANVDLDAALDAAGSVTLGEEDAPETAGDDLMDDMLNASSPAPEEPLLPPQKPLSNKPIYVNPDDIEDPRPIEDLHKGIRDLVIERGGAWLRDILGTMKVNRISDLDKKAAIKVLESPAPKAKAA